jgi:hypothetical protein
MEEERMELSILSPPPTFKLLQKLFAQLFMSVTVCLSKEKGEGDMGKGAGTYFTLGNV